MLGKKIISVEIENSTLATSTINATRRTSNSPKQTDEKGQIWCDFCNKPWHTCETCWQIHGKPADWKPNDKRNKNPCVQPNQNIAETPFSREQMELLKLLKSNISTTAPFGSLAQIASVFSVSSIFSSMSWIIDLDASDHMTNLSKLFQTYAPCPGNQKVRIADGSFSSILGKGQAPISKKLHFNQFYMFLNLLAICYL